MFRWDNKGSNDHPHRAHALCIARASCIMALAFGAPFSLAQDCVKRVHTNLGAPGLADASLGVVNSVEAWDPDGPGPRDEVVIVAGNFSASTNDAVGVRTRTVATWDPATGQWGPLPGTPSGTATITQVLSNNQFLMGTFNGGIYRWDGSGSFHLEGSVANGRIIFMFAEMPNGDVIAGGAFREIGGQPTGYLARFDGESWKPFESGVDGEVHALKVMPNGDLLVGGAFDSAGGQPISLIARWDGEQWHPLGDGLAPPRETFDSVDAIEVLPDGDIVVGALLFDEAGQLDAGNFIFDGTSWSRMGTTSEGQNVEFALSPEGVLYGASTRGRDPVTNELVYAPVYWDGEEWRPIGTQNLVEFFNDIALMEDGTIFAATFGGGLFEDFGLAGSLAQWNGERWYGLGGGIDGRVLAIEPTPDGGYFAAGDFDFAGGVLSPGIALFDGTGWVSLGEGTRANVRGLDLDTDGDLFATGSFGSIDAVAATNIARWDGESWHSLAQGIAGPGYAILATQGGDVYAAGQFASAGGQPASNIARWDGEAWHPLGGGLGGTTRCIIETSTGDIIAGGSFITADNQSANSIARWNGEQWSPLGQGITRSFGSSVVHALAELPGGDIVAAGEFDFADGQPARNVARWDGTQWHPMGAGLQSRAGALKVRSNGELIAADTYPLDRGIARWNGVEWEALTQEINGSPIHALDELSDGDIVVGGEFTSVEDFDGHTFIPSWNIARYTIPDCCLADWDSSGGAPDAADFLAYLNDWSAHAPAADLAPAGGDENWDSSDFLAYLNLYVNGC
ncbi:MAG: GC-type dockerin domain-anchored protein [Phycisphaerales bacterium]|jgi:hypothetical protein|nr:GC-type dockerin domain-anchored protein [Phycisphaerales bacterium]